MAASVALAEAEWCQQILFDVLYGHGPAVDWYSRVGPITSVLRAGCELHNRRLEHQHVVDAKSVFDSLSKTAAGSTQDRRAAIDLSIIRESLQATGSVVRWMPHSLMPVDCLTKADVAKCNDALAHLMQRGTLRLNEECAELVSRSAVRQCTGKAPT